MEKTACRSVAAGQRTGVPDKQPEEPDRESLLLTA